jgi:hypothetical protein
MAQFTSFPDSSQNSLSYQFIDLSTGNVDSWSWDFGDGSFSQEQNPVHIFPVEGTYEVCLSISGPECQSTWCELVTVNPAGECYNFFTYQVSETTVYFQGNHFPEIPAFFSWDFGDGTTGEGQSVSHTYAENGVYYISLLTSDSMNCTAISSQAVVVGDTILFNQVFGQVFEGYLPMSAGQVMIASAQNNPGFEPYMDVVEVDSSGVFVFPYVPYGQFTLYAIPANDNGYLPTYYGGAQHWTEASAITSMESGMLYTINLAAANTTPTFGSGTITGFIDDNLLRSGMLQFIQVMLYSSSWQSLGFTTVNPDGSFSFEGLAMGLYYIFPELPGIYSNYMAVEITDLSPASAVYLEFDGTSILGDKELSGLEKELKIYPNPATSLVKISFESMSSAPVTVQLTDMTGRVCFSDIYQGKTGLVEIPVPLSDLPPGVYLVRVNQGDGMMFSNRVIKR